MPSKQQDTSYYFPLRKENFENEKTIQETLRNPVGNNEDSLQVVEIRPGLYIATIQAKPQVLSRHNFYVEDSPVGFGFHLSGKIEATWKRRPSRKNTSIVNQRGTNCLGRVDDAKGYCQYLSHEILTAVALYIDPLMFTDLIAEELDGIPRESRDLLRQKNFFFSLPMTCEMYNTAARALYHPYQGTAARLHLESCGLELLALQIHRFARQNPRQEKPLLSTDEERIRMAGDILVRQIDSPPTIPALALQVGVNSSKLKRGFKQIFGATIGQFLLQHRMACAREMILNRETDVTQAAFSVGYSNVSHFIRYYKKIYGVTPGCHKQTRGSQDIIPGTE